MKVNFITPTRISLIDITSMGDSSKRGDDSTIGQFDSGLKYAIAILLRNNVSLTIYAEGEGICHDNWTEPTTDVYRFSTYTVTSETKEKELIQVDCENIPHGGAPMSQFDMREPSRSEEWDVKTGFAKALGYNWELWMALRELYSNMLDEGGEVGVFHPSDGGFEGTVMVLEFADDSEFAEIWNNRHLYINEKEPLYSISPRVDALANEEGFLRIYKQNILVYKNEKVPSRYAYNIKFGDIDERRILSNVHSVTSSIIDSIRSSTNEDYLRTIITHDFQTEQDEFMSGYTVWGTASELIHNIAIEVLSKEGKVSSYSWLMKTIRERKDCKIDGKSIQSLGDQVYNYSETVKIESTPEVIQHDETNTDVLTFAEEVRKHFNFDVNVEIHKAKLRGSKVIADKYEKKIIVDESFSIETDMPEFIVQYLDLTKEGNIIKNLSVMICDLIRVQ